MDPMNRRNFLARTALASAALGTSISAEPAVLLRGKADHCIYIWLGGGMGQIDTFDPKQRGDAEKKVAGSYYDAIPTAVNGVQVCEHLPRLAPLMDRITAVRTVHHDVIDEHAAATNRMHTGRTVSGTVAYPSIGSVIASQLGAADEGAPPYVLIGYPNITRGPGFLGAKHGFLYLTDTSRGPEGLSRSAEIDSDRQSRREAMLGTLRNSAVERFGHDPRVRDYDEALGESLNLAGPKFNRAFDLGREPSSLRESYGGEFGQRLLLSRRLIQRGVRFLEVSHNLNFLNGTGWDVHNAGIQQQHLLIRELDQALSALLIDLEQQRLLDKTLIAISTEFGRPPEFDGGGGRGHQGSAFTCVLAGGGLSHCGAFGETDELAREIVRDPVSVPDFFATMHAALGIDYTANLQAGDRPVPITDGGSPIRTLFT
jgi:hypothetical protein